MLYFIILYYITLYYIMLYFILLYYIIYVGLQENPNSSRCRQRRVAESTTSSVVTAMCWLYTCKRLYHPFIYG